jgi:hypothetical protein
MFINCQHEGSTFKLQWANKTTDTAQRKKFLEKKDAIAARDSCIPTMKVVDVKQEKVVSCSELPIWKFVTTY